MRAWAAARESVEALYKSLDSLRAVVEMLDTDRNGVVDREEFRHGLALLNAKLPTPLQGSADELFDAIDTDGSGEITLAELAEAFRATIAPGAA